LLDIDRNERCEAASSREWERMQDKSVSQTGGWYMKEVWMRKNWYSIRT